MRIQVLALPVRRRLTVQAITLAGLILSVLALAVPAHAQQTRTITFDQAIQIALRQNVALKQASNALEQQRTFVFDRRMDFVPDLSLSTSGSYRFGRSIDPVENVIVNQSTQSFSGGVSSGVTLFNGFRNVASLKQARNRADASELSLERSRQTVVFNVISNFLTLIQRQEQIKIQEENLDAQKKQLEQIQAMVNVGSRAISDLYTQQANTSNAELQLINARRDLQLAEVGLIQVLQLDPLDQYNFQAPVINDEDMQLQEYDVDALLRAAFDRRPDLEAQQETIDASRQGVHIARSSYWPSISMSGSYGSSWSSVGKDPITREYAPFGDQIDLNRGGSFSLRLAIPIFDKFATSNSIQRARIDYQNAQLNLDNTRQNIALQVRQAYLDQVTAKKQYEVAQAQLQAAQQSLDAEQERYNVGAATLVELQQSRASYVQAQSDQIRARYSLLFQDKLIQYYTGTLDPTADLFR